MYKILNFGALNLDFVYTVPRIVKSGETISSVKREIFPGGKGLNQSIAAAKAMVNPRSGGKVYHAGAVGKDGEMLVKLLRENNVNTDYVQICDTQTGHAVIQVDENGENGIFLFKGANHSITISEVEKSIAKFSKGDYILLQNEINVTADCLKIAKKHGLITVLNPSPISFSDELSLQLADIIFVNETESRVICGETDENKMLDAMGKILPESDIILTLGGKGVRCRTSKGEIFTHKAYSVEVSDTTAAGDTFTGFYIAAVSAGKSVPEALKIASAAAAISVSRKGASVSVPTFNEVKQFICENL
jgi:ribokinase